MVVFTNVAVSNRIVSLKAAGNFGVRRISDFLLAFDKLYLNLPRSDCFAEFNVGKSRRWWLVSGF